MKPVKHSVAVVVPGPERGPRPTALLVRRPPDDEELPNEWGLPAASLAEGEGWESAVRRIGTEKLGVELDPIVELREGTLTREDYLLHMKLFEARITNGEPSVPQERGDVTQYTDWKWGTADELVPAARQGSLCCRLYLREQGRGWTG